MPSGRLVRGRGLRNPLPTGPPPEHGLYLRGKDPGSYDWPSRWVRWPDFWLPADRAYFTAAARELLDLADSRRVEVACGGGFGRTGTALACIAILDGIPREKAIAYVRRNYSPRAVETPWQKRFVARFG